MEQEIRDFIYYNIISKVEFKIEDIQNFKIDGNKESLKKLIKSKLEEPELESNLKESILILKERKNQEVIYQKNLTYL